MSLGCGRDKCIGAECGNNKDSKCRGGFNNPPWNFQERKAVSDCELHSDADTLKELAAARERIKVLEAFTDKVRCFYNDIKRVCCSTVGIDHEVLMPCAWYRLREKSVQGDCPDDCLFGELRKLTVEAEQLLDKGENQ